MNKELKPKNEPVFIIKELGWIGVDLDGTLVIHDHNTFNPAHVGEPIQPMLKRVKDWLSKGIEVKIFTARVASTSANREEARAAIKAWCREHVGVELDVTAEKDYNMIELWDDRCVQVITNTGEPIVSKKQR